jgi:hypothetical protein
MIKAFHSRFRNAVPLIASEGRKTCQVRRRQIAERLSTLGAVLAAIGSRLSRDAASASARVISDLSETVNEMAFLKETPPALSRRRAESLAQLGSDLVDFSSAISRMNPAPEVEGLASRH